jgi:hypothetical protein
MGITAGLVSGRVYKDKASGGNTYTEIQSISFNSNAARLVVAYSFATVALTNGVDTIEYDWAESTDGMMQVLKFTGCGAYDKTGNSTTNINTASTTDDTASTPLAASNATNIGVAFFGYASNPSIGTFTQSFIQTGITTAQFASPDCSGSMAYNLNVGTTSGIDPQATLGSSQKNCGALAFFTAAAVAPQLLKLVPEVGWPFRPGDGPGLGK